MEPMRVRQDDPLVQLDPALLADPRVVIARSQRPPRPRAARNRRPPGRRVFPYAGPVDPAYLGRQGAGAPLDYRPAPTAWTRLAVQIAVIVAVGTCLGVLIAGLPT
jgi:hypothetical protein